VLLLLYGGLAFMAVLATIRDEDLRWIGLWLLAGFALSNFLHARVNVTDLPGPYSLIEFMVLVAVGVAWDNHRKYWALLVLAGINILSICINIGFGTTFPPSKQQIYLFELTTNICFAAECLLAIGVGLADGLRNGRFAPLSRFWERAVAPHVARAKGPGQ